MEQFLRSQQTLSDERWRAKQREKQKQTTRRLKRDRFDAIVVSITKVFEGGLPTVFEPEGACRHGLRSSLCLQGWSWSDADHCATQIISTVLRKLGAIRPTWQQGQPEWTQDGHAPVERQRCAVCGNPMEPSHHTSPRIYCSDVCRTAAYRERARATREKQTRDEWKASVAAEKAQYRKQRERDCDHCGKAFIRRIEKPMQRFCSKTCADQSGDRRQLADRPCLHCGTMFRPKGDRSKYCSLRCSAAAQSEAMRKPEKACDACRKLFRPVIAKRRFCSLECRAVGLRQKQDRACEFCGSIFRPNSAASKYCSTACGGMARRKERPELTCETCKAIFCPSYAAEKRRFCSTRCNPNAPKRARTPACEETTTSMET